jgi:hypothetical protein
MMQYHQSYDNKKVKHVSHLNIISKYVSKTNESVFNNEILKSEVTSTLSKSRIHT